MTHDVFISYSSHDKPVADAVCARLEANRVRCWIASRDIVPGHDWGESIVAALREARIMVLVFSNNANESPQVKREVERAVHGGLVIVPFRIEDVLPGSSLEYFLSTPHWLDALTPPLEAHLDRLAAVITAFMGGASLESDGPPEGWLSPARRRRPIRPEVVGIGAGLLVMLYILIAGLSNVFPFPSAATSSSTSSPTATQTETFTPWTPENAISTQVTVSGRVSGTCTTSSEFTSDQLAFRCLTTGGDIFDPCLAPPALALENVTMVACVSAPWDPITEMTIPAGGPTQPTDASGTGDGEFADWALQLANGEQCVVSGGDNTTVGGVELTFDCGTGISGGQAGAVDTSSEPWTVQYLAPGADHLVEVAVSTGWAV